MNLPANSEPRLLTSRQTADLLSISTRTFGVSPIEASFRRYESDAQSGTRSATLNDSLPSALGWEATMRRNRKGPEVAPQGPDSMQRHRKCRPLKYRASRSIEQPRRAIAMTAFGKRRYAINTKESSSQDWGGAMSRTGFILLHRQVLDSAVFADPELFRLWIWILCSAAFTRQHVQFKAGHANSVVTLEAGQSLVGRKATSAKLGMPESSFRNRLERLKALEMISLKPDSNWTIVSVTNWRKYQELTDSERTTLGQASKDHFVHENTAVHEQEKLQGGQREDNLRTALGQREDTKNNSKNSNNHKKGNLPFASPSLEEWRAYWNEQDYLVTQTKHSTTTSRSDGGNETARGSGVGKPLLGLHPDVRRNGRRIR